MIIPWPFSPLVLRPALWLDASDASTLYSGGSLAAADGAISEWRDKSGNARHATQATGVSQPLRKTAIQNGRDVVRFDGSNDKLETPAFSTSGFASGSTIIAVAKVAFLNTVNGYRPLVRLPTNNPNGIQHEASNAGTSNSKLEAFTQNTSGVFFRATPSAVTSEGWKLLAATVTTSSITLHKDGVVNGGPTTVTGVIKTGSDTVIVGSDGLASSFCWLGDISEILIFPTALSDADRQSVERYLNAKWAIY